MSLRTLLAGIALAGPLAAAELPPAVAPVKEAIAAERWDDAVAAGEAAVTRAPDSAVAHLWLGKAYGQKAIHASLFSQLGYAKKSRAEFEKAVALDPSSVEARGDLVQYYANAPGIAGGSMEKAREQVKAIEALDAARGAAMNGYLLAREKRTAEAEAEYRRAVALRPADGYLHWRLGRFLERTGRPGEAKASYREAVRLDPGLDHARKDLARLGG